MKRFIAGFGLGIMLFCILVLLNRVKPTTLTSSEFVVSGYTDPQAALIIANVLAERQIFLGSNTPQLKVRAWFVSKDTLQIHASLDGEQVSEYFDRQSDQTDSHLYLQGLALAVSDLAREVKKKPRDWLE